MKNISLLIIIEIKKLISSINIIVEMKKIIIYFKLSQNIIMPNYSF